MRHGTYIGSSFPQLAGKTALLRDDPDETGGVLAQFDDLDSPLAFGWSPFGAGDFKEDEHEE